MSDDPHGADSHPPAGSEPPRWLDDSRNVDRIVWGVYAVCGFLLLIDVFVPRHGPFQVEHLMGFHAVFGFVAYVALVIAAEALRALVKRPEDYYDR